MSNTPILLEGWAPPNPYKMFVNKTILMKLLETNPKLKVMEYLNEETGEVMEVYNATLYNELLMVEMLDKYNLDTPKCKFCGKKEKKNKPNTKVTDSTIFVEIIKGE